VTRDIWTQVARLLPLTPEYAALRSVPHLREFVVDLGCRMFEAGQTVGGVEAKRDEDALRALVAEAAPWVEECLAHSAWPAEWLERARALGVEVEA